MLITQTGLALHLRTTIGAGRHLRRGAADKRLQKQEEFLSKHESFLDCLLLVRRLRIWFDEVLHQVAFADSAGVVAKAKPPGLLTPWLTILLQIGAGARSAALRASLIEAKGTASERGAARLAH
jgi:hypothetical protein